METYKFTGRVVAVGKTEKLGSNPDKPFYKRTLVMDGAEPNARFPNPLPFEAVGDKCKTLDGLRQGATAEITFTLNGREWKDRQGQTRWFGSNRIVEVRAIEEVVPDIPLAGCTAEAETEDIDMPF